MKLSKGQQAIDFTIRDAYDSEIKLSSYGGQKILLSFFRNVNCPFCNMRVHELSKMREQIERKGLKMIFFFESNTGHLKRSVFHQEVSPIPLIGDPEKQVYRQYGVEASHLKMLKTFFKSGSMGTMQQGNQLNVPKEKEKHVTQNLIPADFLIDENFIIQKAHYGSNLRDHIPVEEITSFAGTT